MRESTLGRLKIRAVAKLLEVPRVSFLVLCSLFEKCDELLSGLAAVDGVSGDGVKVVEEVYGERKLVLHYELYD